MENSQTEAAAHCPHLGLETFGIACPHVYSKSANGYIIAFTGHDLQYDLICGECSRHKEVAKKSYVRLCENCFQAVEDEGYEEGLNRKPQIRERRSSLKFVHRQVSLPGWDERKLHCIQPENNESSRWIALSADGELQLDLDEENVALLMQLPSEHIDLNESVLLRLSSNSQFAAIASERGEKGFVVDLRAKKVTMHLNRGDYHNEQTIFPIVFFEDDNKRVLLVHATDWNRLDISDPLTGELLTKREPTSYVQGEPQPEHYLDYFHGGLTVSPDNKWIVDNGWVWAPVGVVRTWNLQQWLSSNVWESEDGQSIRNLCERAYFWGGPLCWIDNQTLAVWGFGGDDEYLIPAVLLFDVESKKRLRWFAGPQGELTFDVYLFSSSKEHGTAVWDIETGERLCHEDKLNYLSYHRGTKQFLSFNAAGQFQISRLSEQL